LPIQITHNAGGSLTVQLRTADGRYVQAAFMTAEAADELKPGESYKVSFYTTKRVEDVDDLVVAQIDVYDNEKPIGGGMIYGVFGHLGDPSKKIAEEQKRRRGGNHPS
jgi:hypothetical protein